MLEASERYPHCFRYHYGPGPHSTPYAAWVLREAGIRHPLARRAIGRNYPS